MLQEIKQKSKRLNDCWPILFKFGTTIKVCNNLDKFGGKDNNSSVFNVLLGQFYVST